MTRAGFAQVTIRDGRQYIGRAEIDGSWLHLTSARRVVQHCDWVQHCAGNDAVSWPQREVKRIHWLDDVELARAA